MWLSAVAYKSEKDPLFLNNEVDVNAILKALQITKVSDVMITDSSYCSFDVDSTVEVLAMTHFVGGPKNDVTLSDGKTEMRVCRLTGSDGRPQFVGFMVDEAQSDNKNVVFIASEMGSDLLDQF
jgi:hypothetical protein